MRRQNHLRIGQCLDRLEQMIGRFGKARQCIRVQHQVSLRGQRRQHKIAGARANAGARSDHAGVEALVRQQLGKLDHRIGCANHHGGERGGIDGERIPRRGQRDQPGTGPQRAARRHPRRAGRSKVARNDDGMATRVFLTVDLRHRKGLAPELRHVLKSLRLNFPEHAGIDPDIGDTDAAAMDPARQQ